MTTNSAEKEKEKGVETSFFDLKLKTFIAELRNAANRNPDIFFYSVSLVQKLVLEGKRASIAESGKDVAGMDEVFFRIGGENDISIDHDFGGKKIHCRIAKRTKAESLAYEIEGSLQIGGEVVDFRIDEEKPRFTSGSFEHVAGVDWMMAQYDKAFLAYSKEYNGMKDRLEEHSRKTIIDAARDRLFGKDDASGSQ
jgi:hypothetical protein